MKRTYIFGQLQRIQLQCSPRSAFVSPSSEPGLIGTYTAIHTSAFSLFVFIVTIFPLHFGSQRASWVCIPIFLFYYIIAYVGLRCWFPTYCSSSLFIGIYTFPVEVTVCFVAFADGVIRAMDSHSLMVYTKQVKSFTEAVHSHHNSQLSSRRIHKEMLCSRPRILWNIL